MRNDFGTALRHDIKNYRQAFVLDGFLFCILLTKKALRAKLESSKNKFIARQSHFAVLILTRSRRAVKRKAD